MTARALTRPVRRLRACMRRPELWTVTRPDVTAADIRYAVGHCNVCPFQRECLSIPKEKRGRGVVLGGQIVADDQDWRDPETYIRQSLPQMRGAVLAALATQTAEDKAAAEQPVELIAGIDVRKVNLLHIRDALRGVSSFPTAPDRNTRWVAIYLGVTEYHLTDREIAEAIRSPRGKPWPDAVRRTRRDTLHLPPGPTLRPNEASTGEAVPA